MDVDGIKIEFLGHDGFLIECKDGMRIIIDPYNVSDSVGKADFILITHSHYDHCSIKDIGKLVKEETVIVVPADVQSKITKIEKVHMEVVEIGDEIELGKFKIEVVPAYNIGKDFHPKSEGWFGYLIKMRNVIIYHAGDSDNTPEMKSLSGYGKHGNKFIALLPVSGKYVMDAVEAAEAAKMLNPSMAIPMHYGSGVVGTIEDAKEFVELCKQKGINAEILERI
ncbi:MAG: MBL fold metallo-hydrolase [Nanoarchaeota archaeon]